MKRNVLLALALVMVLFLPGCGGEVSVWQETPVVPQTNESLTVFCLWDDEVGEKLQLALDRFRQMYPDVKVELVKPQYDITNVELGRELYEQMAVQIMSGEGPDVFVVDDTIMDVEKMVRQGVFADMEPYFQADNFDWEPYNQTVMDGGVWHEKRFLIPLSYTFPLLVTSRTALEETGFDMTACGDFQGFLEETTRYMEDETQTRQLFRYPTNVTNIVEYSGLPVADYDNRTVDLSSPLFKTGVQWCKNVMASCPKDFHDNYSDSSLYGAAAIRDGDVLWTASVHGPLSNFYRNFAALKTVDEAVMMPIRDLDGGIQARIENSVGVRANSENLRNAYNFIKLLLGRTVQSESQYGFNVTFTVLDAANEDYFIRMSDKHLTAADTDGFVSPTTSYYAVERPTREEFDQIMGYTREISGTYYNSHLGLYEAMEPYFMEGADFDETLAEAQRQLERYITE